MASRATPPLPQAHQRLLDLLRDASTPLGAVAYPVLCARAERTTGDVFFVPLVSRRDPRCLAERLELARDLDALIVTWSPSDTRREVGAPPTILLVLDERDWKKSAVLDYSLGDTADRSAGMLAELELEQQGFFTGLISLVLTGDGVRQRVKTEDVCPQPWLPKQARQGVRQTQVRS
jgi:hypothetical protein